MVHSTRHGEGASMWIASGGLCGDRIPMLRFRSDCCRSLSLETKPIHSGTPKNHPSKPFLKDPENKVSLKK
jgi:hypothetical protein